MTKADVSYCKYLKRGNDKTCGRFDNPHNTVILKTLCTKCGEVTEYAIK